MKQLIRSEENKKIQSIRTEERTENQSIRPEGSEGRIFFWDNLKGLLILLVVLGHFLFAYRHHLSIDWIVGAIYTFHMPAFAFASGYLSAQSKTKSLKPYVFLLCAYAVFNTLAIFYFFLLHQQTVSLFVPYVSFWYLLALIAWRLLIRFVPKSPSALIVSTVFALIVGFSAQITNVLAFARTIAFFPFFLFGAMLPWERIRVYRAQRKVPSRTIGILAAILCLFSIVTLVPQVLRFDEYLMFPYIFAGDPLRRIGIFAISFLAILSALLLLPDRKIRFLSTWGKNSLSIFLLHRFITLMAADFLPIGDRALPAVIFSLAATALTVPILGHDSAGKTMRRFIDGMKNRLAFSSDRENKRKNRVFRLLGLLALSILFALSAIGDGTVFQKPAEKRDSIPPIISVLQKDDRERIENSLCIAYVGDLILLRGQVIAAYDAESDAYDFSEMFAYASDYLDADLSIGVFEGPMAGADLPFSSSDFADGLPLWLNFPDSFAHAVRDAGIDFVTVANNHLLDQGVEGAYRTLDVLDDLGILHVGSYRNAKEKEDVFVIERNGVRIGVLAYTYGSNGKDDAYFLFEKPDLTRTLVSPESPYFDEVRASVERDFEKLRAENPDLILVLPHMGTQFSHQTDLYQRTWNEIFVRAGADLVLGDHAHAVQPIEYVDTTDADGANRTALIVNCPGNFANSFVAFDGDATSIVKIYVDRDSHEVLCCSVIPMWTHGNADGFFRALPIYEILRNKDLRSELSANDMNRVEEVQEIVTSVMLGTRVATKQAHEEYFLFPEGYRRPKVPPLHYEAPSFQTEQLQMILDSKSICFIGDSVTCGSNNGGYPWFEPLESAFPQKDFSSVAFGGATTRTLRLAEEIEQARADLFIIAIGANDIRYRDESICAMTPEAYVLEMDALTQKIAIQNPDAHFIYVAAWPALDSDRFTPLLPEEKKAMYQEYANALQAYCADNAYRFVDPSERILACLAAAPVRQYLEDHIHPNGTYGVRLYSQAFLEA